MALYRVINRYATALLDDAVLNNKLDVIFKDASSFVDVCNNNREVILLLKNPIIQSRKKRSILFLIFESSFDKTSLEFISLVIRHKRETLLKDIFQQFIQLYKGEKGIVDAEVVSAVPLDKNVLEKIKNYVVKVSGGNSVKLTNKTNPDLIGGFALKYHDKLIDASVLNRLKNLKKHLQEN